MIDLDAHISSRTLQHVVGERFLLLLLLYIIARIECSKVWILPRRCQETHIELSVSVDHLHLLTELRHVESLGSFDGRWCLHWEHGGFLRLHLPQTHHVVGQVEAVVL